MLRINELRLPIDHTKADLYQKIKKLLRTKEDFKYEIVRRSLDARKKPVLYFSYIIDITVANEALVLRYADKKVVKTEKKDYSFPHSIADIANNNRPVVIGLGPAGLFAALYLSRAGFRPIVFERGSDINNRRKEVDDFWEKGTLNKNSNVQFGEGGAGAFSDGKLNTLVKDKYGRNKAVLKDLVLKGAPSEILYDHKPHVGTDLLTQVVASISDEIRSNGGDIYYNTAVTDFIIEGDTLKGIRTDKGKELIGHPVVLSIGHSARDTFNTLYDLGVIMEPKSFAVGLRVEHKATLINENQYGSSQVPTLGNANYKLTHQCKDGRGVYSFCMCPGGYVINASSEDRRLAINGMSYHDRAAENSNSAIIVAVNPLDYGDGINPMSGIEFQRLLEEKAYEIGKGKIPVESYGEYKAQKLDLNIQLNPCIKGEFTHSNVHDILPDYLMKDFIEGMEAFGCTIKGFNDNETLVSGIESRTSSPIRIPRDDSFQANIKGLFPAGEGAGYAGGITSAAMDGIAVAEKVAEYIINLDD